MRKPLKKWKISTRTINKVANSLYIHIPFCAHICSYCDFSKVLYDEKWAFQYIKELEKEIDSYHIDHKLETIYIGGGTPTCLKDELLDEILAYVSPLLKEDGEFTIEGNPENINEKKLSILKKRGVNRLSIGLESSKKEFLDLMGRKHTYEDTKNAVNLAKKVGINNISVDIIYALPKQTLEDLSADIDALLALDVPHLSSYSLTISKGTLFYNKGYKETDDELSATMYELILNRLREAGYTRYEVSNFAKDEQYSRHNLVYWHDKEYYGVGLGASGYLKNIRYTNTRSLKEYLNGNYIAEKEELSIESQLEDYFLTNLRLSSGFKKGDFQNRFGFSFSSKYKNQLDKLKNEGLLVEDESSIFPTDKGILLLDRILLALF